MSITVSTPSRLCLFGEHLDYLSLEVVTMAIDLRFYATIDKRDDGQVVIHIKDSSIATLNQKNNKKKYEIKQFAVNKEIVYESNRDYFKSAINVIKKKGYDISKGFNVTMDSMIPIGKGMCSSSTMIIVFIKAVLEAIDADIKNDKQALVELAYNAEVAEFNEPGGKMDHIASIYGGICHVDFKVFDKPLVTKLTTIPKGIFILVDSKQQKDTIKVLQNAKDPVIRALLNIPSIRDMVSNNTFDDYLSKIPTKESNALKAAIDNYKILLDFMSNQSTNTHESLGKGLKKHHKNLRDGLGLSTKAIEEILNIAYNFGATGGKINGSGGGGCCYIFTSKEKVNAIIKEIEKAGYPTRIVSIAEGVRVE
ncbi:MAG: hypothetical protein KAG94_02740 [Clostridiales bacterium]|nr:hypothetical protein [Clostridiales bacterium]